MKTPQAPLYQDPMYCGATDPTMIWNREEKQWWMVYTQRRATAPGQDVAWVHGTDLGVASSPDGHNWLYRGVLEGLAFEPGRNTWWAPEILYHEGLYHMYASYIRGVPTSWARPRSIIHYTSENLWNWQVQSALPLGSDRVIDAGVARLANGTWRMWYKDEDDESCSHYADSDDLYHWQHKGRAVDYDHHEGANVFYLQGAWWYVGDFWRGLGVLRSSDCLSWEFCGYILDKPGVRPGDGSIGHHADVVVQGDEGYIFYFTHPPKDSANAAGGKEKFSFIQVARLTSDGKNLFCNRDEDFDFALQPPQD